jgi:Na+-transporting methylmalonyl-CoA/oxaloacetate decarboxylase gamma subunit
MPDTIDEGILLMVVGMLTVVTALLLVQLVITVLPKLKPFRMVEAPVMAPAETAVFSDAVSAIPSEEEMDRHMVVIAAAVAAVVGSRARVRQVRAIRTPVSAAWARQGRISIQGSHNLPVQRSSRPGGSVSSQE